MAIKNSQRLMESRKKREEGALTSSSTTGVSNSDRLRKSKLEKSIGFDTFESDLTNMNTTLSSVAGGWQSQETMANTRASVENMYKRANDYQNYIGKYQPDAKSNISDITSYYKNVLDNWDNIAGAYGQYKDAESYSKAMKKLELDKKYAGLSYDAVQKEKAKHGADSDEYKYLDSYTGYTSLEDFDKALRSSGSRSMGSVLELFQIF